MIPRHSKFVWIFLFKEQLHISVLPKESHKYEPRNSSLLALNLLSQNVLQSDGISSEFRDAFPEFLNSHCFFVEIEPEQRLVLNVRLLWDVESCGIFGVQLLRDFVLRIEKLLKQIRLKVIVSCRE